jgi:hypothetical protein
MVFENRVLRRISGLKREKVAGGWRRLHNEVLYNFLLFRKYNYDHQIKVYRCAEHVARIKK